MKENKFGLILKSIRQNMDLSQEEMATKLGTTKQVLSRYETGKRIPKISTVAEYAEKLNLPIDIFWGEKKISESKAFAQTNKYENITALLDQLNPKGIAEAERHTKYLTTQNEYKKNKEILTFKANENKLIAYGGDDVQISKEEYDELVEQSRKDRKTKGWE